MVIRTNTLVLGLPLTFKKCDGLVYCASTTSERRRIHYVHLQLRLTHHEVVRMHMSDYRAIFTSQCVSDSYVNTIRIGHMASEYGCALILN